MWDWKLDLFHFQTIIICTSMQWECLVIKEILFNQENSSWIENHDFQANFSGCCVSLWSWKGKCWFWHQIRLANDHECKTTMMTHFSLPRQAILLWISAQQLGGLGRLLGQNLLPAHSASLHPATENFLMQKYCSQIKAILTTGLIFLTEVQVHLGVSGGFASVNLDSACLRGVGHVHHPHTF